MALIVDAYNVLHQSHKLPPEYGTIGVGDLCRLLERSRWSGRRITVVCDGSPKPDEGDYVGAVDLRHSGRNRDADSVIVELIDADTGPRDLVVVSNDGEIRRAARRRRARTMSAEHFLRSLVQQPRRRSEQPDKPAPSSDVDAWLDEFGLGDESVEQIEREAENEARARQPQTEHIDDQSTQPPQPRRFKPDAPSTTERTKPPNARRVSESETEFWLREFGLEDQADQDKD